MEKNKISSLIFALSSSYNVDLGYKVTLNSYIGFTHTSMLDLELFRLFALASKSWIDP